MDIMRFENNSLLWLLLLLLPMVAYYVYRTMQGSATIQISSTDALKGVPRSVKYYLRHLPFVLRCMTVALVIIAMARPQGVSTDSTTTTEGIDIVVALDISGSMLARDFDPDRISAAKDVVARFISERPNDRIGLVVFAGESFTQCPLTTDKRTVLNMLSQVESGIIEDGTAIGNGLATAINRLKESNAKSKVVILLTDGINNSGQIAPLTAAEIANTFGIRVYTIGVGSMGTAPYPAIDVWGNVSFVPVKVEIDEQVLTDIAEKTGGRYFRATDNRKLSEIYDEINKLEKTKIDVEHNTRFEDFYQVFLLCALISFIAEVLLKLLWIKRLP